MNEKLLQMARSVVGSDHHMLYTGEMFVFREDQLARFTELVREDDKRDAERYRWLRDIGDETWKPFRERTGYSAQQCDDAVDNAIRSRGRS